MSLRTTEITLCRICREDRAFRSRRRKEGCHSTDTDMLNSTAITFIIIYTVEAVSIIIGNAFTIFVFWTRKLHQKRTCFLLINLAVADLLVGISEASALAAEKIPRMESIRGQKKDAENHPSFALQIFASHTSVYFLALISLERVFAILWPLRHRVTKTRDYIYSIVVVWGVGLCLGGLILLSMYYTKVIRGYVTVTIHLCLFIALLVICTSYLKIRNRLRCTPAEIAHQTNRSTEHNLRLSRTMFIVIAASLVLWLPAFVVYTARAFCPRCFSPLVVRVVNVLHLANSMINPFVYTFRMPIFKDAVKKAWLKQRQNVEIRPVQSGGRVALSLEGSRLHVPNRAYNPPVSAAGHRTCHTTHSNADSQTLAEIGF